MFRELLRKAKGVLGLGVFGAGLFASLGLTLNVIFALTLGYPFAFVSQMGAWLIQGFIVGALSALGMIAATAGGRPLKPGLVFLAGIPAGLVLSSLVLTYGLGISPIENLTGLAAVAVVAGSMVGLTGVLAVKIADAAPDDALPGPDTPRALGPN